MREVIIAECGFLHGTIAQHPLQRGNIAGAQERLGKPRNLEE
jgi:hypothetical protein